MPDSSSNTLGFAHLWVSGDAISHFVAVLLALMSIASWYLILVKTLDWWRLRRAARHVAAFWAADSLEVGLAALDRGNDASPYLELAAQATLTYNPAEPQQKQAQ
jgi:biopolymer transport protein ExbB